MGSLRVHGWHLIVLGIAADAPSSADGLSAKRSSNAKVQQSVKHPKTAALNLSHASTGLQALASAAQSRPETHQPNAYESAGADPEHIKARLRDATCNCQGPCHKAVNYKELLPVCQLFWGLFTEERGLSSST